VTLQKKLKVNLNQSEKILLILILSILFISVLTNISVAENTSVSDSVCVAKGLKKSSQWWGKDKVQHFLLSGVIAGFSYKICKDAFNKDKDTSLKFSIGFTLSLGLGKEVYDHIKPEKSFCGKDLVFDILGAGSGIFIATR